MQNEIESAMEREDGSTGVVSRELVEQYLDDSEEVQLSGKDREAFIAIAIIYQLNPYKREIHAKTSQDNGKERVHFIVGYEVYIKKAERTGLLDGWKAWIEGRGESLKAVVEIQRKDWKNPFVHEVYWSEAVQRRADGSIYEFWERMPRFQLKKVAISQGFRLCFSDEIGGIPYDGAELSIQEIPISSETPLKEKHENPQGTSALPRQTRIPNKETAGSLVETIHALVMAHKVILSDQHLEWIENQLRQEKSEAQLRGLMKHVEETVSTGGDVKTVTTKPPERSTYPKNANIAKRPRIPATNGHLAIPQTIPIF